MLLYGSAYIRLDQPFWLCKGGEVINILHSLCSACCSRAYSLSICILSVYHNTTRLLSEMATVCLH